MSKVEIIVLNDQDAKVAEAFGADTLELDSAIGEGGLTPSYGAIKRVTKSVKVPVMVMIRPHSYSFVYRKDEWNMMKEDIRIVQEIGAAGIVFGAITKEKSVDFDLLSMVLEEAKGLSVTFHRAIDEANTSEIYDSLCKSSHPIDRILTSGGKSTVSKGLDTLSLLINSAEKSTKNPIIMPGSGLDSNNIEFLHQQLKADEYHFGSGVRFNGDFRHSINGNKIQKIKDIVSH